MRTARTITTDIGRPPGAVFAALTNLTGFGAWLDRSSTYRGTTDVSDAPITVGTSYTDHIPGARVFGTVLEYRPNELVVFRQATKRDRLAITIRYALSPSPADPTGTRVIRTGEIETNGPLSLLHPLVVRVTQRENARTMAELKRHLESQAA